MSDAEHAVVQKASSVAGLLYSSGVILTDGSHGAETEKLSEPRYDTAGIR